MRPRLLLAATAAAALLSVAACSDTTTAPRRFEPGTLRKDMSPGPDGTCRGGYHTPRGQGRTEMLVCDGRGTEKRPREATASRGRPHSPSPHSLLYRHPHRMIPLVHVQRRPRDAAREG